MNPTVTRGYTTIMSQPRDDRLAVSIEMEVCVGSTQLAGTNQGLLSAAHRIASLRIDGY